MSAPAAAAPQRIASVNLCTDQLVLLLADRSRIASLSSRAFDETVSNVVALAQGIPPNDGRVEEIAALKPDLVLADRFWNARASRFMQKLGIPVHGVAWADTLAQSRAVIRDVAAAIGEEARGEALVEAIDSRLAAVRAQAQGKPRPRAALYRPNGYTAGRDTLFHELMEIAGLANAAAEAGLDYWGELSLEAIIVARPDLLIVDDLSLPRTSRAEMVLRHPALAALPGLRFVGLPARLTLCPGPWIADAAEALVAKPPEATH